MPRCWKTRPVLRTLAQLRSNRNLLEDFVAGIHSVLPPNDAFLSFKLWYRIVGFLFGFSVASSYAAYHLLEEYQRASAALQASVETLQLSTEKVLSSSIYQLCLVLTNLGAQISAHIQRIDAVEKDLKALSQASASKEDISRVRAEAKKLLDGLHVGWCLSLMTRRRNFISNCPLHRILRLALTRLGYTWAWCAD